MTTPSPHKDQEKETTANEPEISNKLAVPKWEEEFDRMKTVYSNLVAVSEANVSSSGAIKRLRVSGIPDVDDLESVINECDSLTANGTWAVVAGTAATNITRDATNYVNGSASLNFDFDTSGATASINNTDMNDVDLTDFEGQDVFAWVYIPSIGTSITNFILRWGSDDTANYYTTTVTTNNEGQAFYVGWNLLRFAWPTSATGSPSITAVDSLRFIVTLGSTPGSAITDWRLDFVVARRGEINDVLYYSKYGWQDSDETYKENATATTDFLNVDVPLGSFWSGTSSPFTTEFVALQAIP